MSLVVLMLFALLAPQTPAETPPAGTPPAATAPSESAPPAPAVTQLRIDPAESEVGFALSTTWHDVHGSTNLVTGEVTLGSTDTFEGGRVSVEIDAARLTTGIDARDRKMREEYLETGKFPKITFVSTEDARLVSSSRNWSAGYGEVTLWVPGNLTIHGVAHRVVLMADARIDAAAWTVRGEVQVKLSDYGIPDPSIFLNRVRDEVTVTFAVKAKPARS